MVKSIKWIKQELIGARGMHKIILILCDDAC